MKSRKELWHFFYAHIISELLISDNISSPTLKSICSHSSLKKTITDMKYFFDTADKNKLEQFVTTVFEETYGILSSRILLDTLAIA